MAITTITTGGEQLVTAIGPIAGTLDMSTRTGDYTVKVRVRDLTVGGKLMLGIEDTASATPFTDAQAVVVDHFTGTGSELDTAKESRAYDIPFALYGAVNNKLRVNVYRLSAGATAQVEAWVE